MPYKEKYDDFFSYTLITRLSDWSGLEKANYLLESVQLGQDDPKAASCESTYYRCPSRIWNKSKIVASFFEAPLMLWKMTESYLFPYHWFQRLKQCHSNETSSA